jgi:FkbM family methyltransferase
MGQEHPMEAEDIEATQNDYMQTIRKTKGLLKSRIIYDFNPFKRLRLEQFYRRFIAKGDLCFDLGAHTGNHTKVWLRMGARVIALEPQPLFVNLMKSKLASYPGLVIIQKAVADRPGLQLFKICSRNPSISTLSDDWMKEMWKYDDSLIWDETIETEVTTLDELIGNYGLPAFCKIDVEGYEERVLSELSIVLPALSFEFFPTTPRRTVSCIEILGKLGRYLFNWSLADSFRFKSPTWMNREEMAKEIEDYQGKKSGDIYAISEKQSR